LQPGGVWLVEKAVNELDDSEVAAALRTCHVRGWIEVLADAVPTGNVKQNGTLPTLERQTPIYRLTEAGWNSIYRTQGWILATFIVVTATFAVATLSLILSLSK